MAVYRPTYKDPKTGQQVQSSTWWYEFSFSGRRIRESSKSTRKTIAIEAEKNRKRELQERFNAIEDKRVERIRTVNELASEFLADYKVRQPRSFKFAKWALGHVRRIAGNMMAVDVSDRVVVNYQTKRLGEDASPKSVNEEVGFFIRILPEAMADSLRGKLRRANTLKLKTRSEVGKAFSESEKEALLAAAKKRRSPAIYPALMLALNAGLRDKEIRNLQWSRLDLHRAVVTVGDSKTAAGQGRTIPLNDSVLEALKSHAQWYLTKFGETRGDWYVFPFGKPQPTDPEKPMTTFKTVWGKVKDDAGVKGRWHDSRHSFITSLAESGEASDETIRDIAGHVSKQMLKHYSHIGMQAKRRAVAALVKKSEEPQQEVNFFEVPKESPKVEQIQ